MLTQRTICLTPSQVLPSLGWQVDPLWVEESGMEHAYEYEYELAVARHREAGVEALDTAQFAGSRKSSRTSNSTGTPRSAPHSN